MRDFWKELTSNALDLLKVLDQSSLAKAQQECAELRWQELDDLQNLRRWDKKAINAMNETIRRWDVDSNDLGVEVDDNTAEAEPSREALGLVTDQGLIEERGHSVGEQKATCWIETW
jgi:hypothetical protein